MRSDERFTIIAIANDGQPIEPRWTKDAFSAQCGAIVRDNIPVSIQLWNKPKKEDLKFLMSPIERKMIFGPR